MILYRAYEKGVILTFSEVKPSSNATSCPKPTTEPTIYCNEGSVKSYLVQIAARYAGKSLKVQNHTNDTRQQGSVVYEDGSTSLSDGNAIAFYLANSQLKGSSLLTQSQVLQWLSIADNSLLPSVCGWVLPATSAANKPKESMNEARNSLLKEVDALNKALANGTFLVGDKVTLADIAVFAALLPAYEHVLDSETRTKYQNVDRWFETILKESHVTSVIGNFKYFQKK